MFVFFFVPGYHLSGFRKLTFQVSEFVPLCVSLIAQLFCELRLINGRDRLAGFRPPQQISTGFASWLLGFVTAATSLNGTPPNFARCLAVCWTGILYIYIFGGSCLLTEFCQVQNSHCVQVIAFSCFGSVTARHWSSGRQPNLRRGTRNGIMELSLLIIFNRGRHLYSEGGHHVGHRPTF